MEYRVAPLAPTPKELIGLSERLITSHYENNYGGAVRRLNAISRDLAQLDPSSAPGYLVNGLKREELVAANSMILHEIYFDGLGPAGSGPGTALGSALERDFGSINRWQAEFSAMGRALGGGSGWVLLTWFPRQGCLLNQWAADHAHLLAAGQPILALDMYEHAYHMDFGAKAAAYVDSYMRNIHWDWAEQRYLQVATGGPAPVRLYGALALAPEILRDRLSAGVAPLLVDVRRRPAFDAGRDMIAGAIWRAPEQLETWADELALDREVILYCVYGHNVSEDAAAALRVKGINARPLAGGIAAWHALDGPAQPKAG